MQSFDEIKRMADMARTMRERGLAKDSLDAVQQAQMATSSDPAFVQQRKENALQERINTLERKMDMSQKRIEELQSSLESANKRLADTVTLLTNVNTKLRDLESNQATAQLAPIAPIPVSQEAQWQSQQWNPQAAQQWQAPPQRPEQQPAWMAAAPPQMRGGDKPIETKPIDRNGVAPSDVSVEKFFYFGNKR